MGEKKTIKVTQIKSTIGRKPDHIATMRGLGLRRIRQTVELDDTPSIRAMNNKVSWMVNVEE